MRCEQLHPERRADWFAGWKRLWSGERIANDVQRVSLIIITVGLAVRGGGFGCDGRAVCQLSFGYLRDVSVSRCL